MPKNINRTNPGSPNPRYDPSNKGHWDHKEAVIRELIALGVPLRNAEIASIDLGTLFAIAFRNKLGPKETANMIYDAVKRHCTNEDGKWRYQTTEPVDVST